MMKSTKIQASSISELTTLVNRIKKIAYDWCEKHKNYEYKIKVNHKDLVIDFNIMKL